MKWRDTEIKLADPAAQMEEALDENRRLAWEIYRNRGTVTVLAVTILVLLIVVVGLGLALVLGFLAQGCF